MIIFIIIQNSLHKYIAGISNSAKSFSSGLGKSYGAESGKPVDGTDHTKQISKK